MAWKNTSRALKLIPVLIVKVLRLPPRWFPKGMQKFLLHWDTSQIWVHVKTLGTRIYMDQPCEYKVTSTEARAEVADEYKLSPKELEDFFHKGYSEAYTVVSEEEMAHYQREIETLLETESKTFGMKTVRDRHLDSAFLLGLFKHPAITERLAQFLGPDILIWRSQVFNQEAGATPITWHQASTYMIENLRRPVLKPRDRNDLFQLTVWIAVDDANMENGCVRFIPGTHDRIRTIDLTGKTKFYNAAFDMGIDDNVEAEYRPLRPGQFIIFSERVIHGNNGNRSQNRRMGINFRAITTDTLVYEGVTKHKAMHFKKSWDLENWGVLTLRGEDKHKLNRTVEPPRESVTT